MALNQPRDRARNTARLLERAVHLHQQGDRAGARAIYRKILKKDPDHSDALNFLAMAAHQEGDQENAIRLMERAVASKPDNTAALRNLGNLMIEAEKPAQAIQHYRQALRHEPKEASIFANLCVAHRHAGELARAIEAGRQATLMGPDQKIAWYNLGNAFRADKKYSSAIKAYRKALALDPGLTIAHDNLCRTTLAMESSSLLGRSKLRRTRQAYRTWLEQEPDNPVAAFMLGAVEGKDVSRAPDSVITSLFDRSAATFEQHLARLEYHVPELLERLLPTELGEPRGNLAVLDGGCGTGLCAPFLRPYAQHLIGIDLSSGMLEKARRRELYDKLIEGELTSQLNSLDQSFDLVVFADTLCYFGDLGPVFQGVARALKPGGRFVFTVEKADERSARKGHLLHPQGRYSHTKSYVESQLRRYGFESLSCRAETLRLEIGAPVKGLLVVAIANQAE